MDALLVPFAQGRLDEEFTRNKLFMTPGDTYSVSILTPDPFVEVLGRQVRGAPSDCELRRSRRDAARGRAPREADKCVRAARRRVKRAGSWSRSCSTRRTRSSSWPAAGSASAATPSAACACTASSSPTPSASHCHLQRSSRVKALSTVTLTRCVPSRCCVRRPPLPPTVRPEWCEEPSAYARRLIDTLIDGILQQRAADSAVAVVTEHWATTGEDGIATFFMPPGAEVTVTCEVGELYEETNSTVTRTLSRVRACCERGATVSVRRPRAHHAPLSFSRTLWLLCATQEREQFSGFLLERIAFTRVSVLDCKSGESVPGFAFKAYDVTHLVSRPPEAGIAVDKTGAVKSKSSRKSSRNLKATR